MLSCACVVLLFKILRDLSLLLASSLELLQRPDPRHSRRWIALNW